MHLWFDFKTANVHLFLKKTTLRRLMNHDARKFDDVFSHFDTVHYSTTAELL